MSPSPLQALLCSMTSAVSQWGKSSCPPCYLCSPTLFAEQLPASFALPPFPSIHSTPPHPTRPPPHTPHTCSTACTACRMLAWACQHLSPLARPSQHMLPCWSKPCPSCSCWELTLEAPHPAGRSTKQPKTGCMAYWKHLRRSVPQLELAFVCDCCETNIPPS